MHITAFGSSSPRTRALKVMLMLIEAGILYVLSFVSFFYVFPPRQLLKIYF